jgi:endonuclease YncB( thermonuclease family)
MSRWIVLLGVGLISSVAVDRQIKDDEPTTFEAQCKATDGDSLNCGGLRVRLLGVDAAEMPGHCRAGRDCAPGDPYIHKAALERFVMQPVRISPIKKDRYGRTVASVTDKSGKNASCAAILAGSRYIPKWDHRMLIARTCVAELQILKNVKMNQKGE